MLNMVDLEPNTTQESTLTNIIYMQYILIHYFPLNV